MVRFRCSFLVRWWELDRGGTRIEVEQIQTGSKTVVASMEEALAWMSDTAESDTPFAPDIQDECEQSGQIRKTGDATDRNRQS